MATWATPRELRIYSDTRQTKTTLISTEELLVLRLVNDHLFLSSTTKIRPIFPDQISTFFQKKGQICTSLTNFRCIAPGGAGCGLFGGGTSSIRLFFFIGGLRPPALSEGHFFEFSSEKVVSQCSKKVLLLHETRKNDYLQTSHDCNSDVEVSSIHPPVSQHSR